MAVLEFTQIKLMISPLRPQSMPEWLSEILYDMSDSVFDLTKEQFKQRIFKSKPTSLKKEIK